MTDYTLLALTVIGLVSTPLTIVMWNIFKERQQSKDINYKKWYTRQVMKHPELRVPAKQVKDLIAPKQDKPDMMSLVKNLDIDKIKGLLSVAQAQGSDIEEGGGDIIDSLVGFAQDNPEIVQSFLSGFKNKGKQEDTIHYE